MSISRQINACPTLRLEYALSLKKNLLESRLGLFFIQYIYSARG